MSATWSVRQQANSSDTPMVSVVMTAYNSQATLARALESVLMQHVSFPVEIVVGDDCSTDGTVAIAREFAVRHPAVVRVLAQPQNVGIMRNYADVFTACRGRYLAWLDADDFWTDPQKLALQVAALEQDPTLAVVGHAVRWVTPTGEVKRARMPERSGGRYTQADLLRTNFLPSPSLMFRSGIERQLPSWYFHLTGMTDWPLTLLAAGKGDILLLDSVMADYTLSAGGSLWGKGEAFWYELDARFYGQVQSILPQHLRQLARREQGIRYQHLAYCLRQQGDLIRSRQAAVKALLAPALLDDLGSKWKAVAAALWHEARWRISGSRRHAGKVPA